MKHHSSPRGLFHRVKLLWKLGNALYPTLNVADGPSRRRCLGPLTRPLWFCALPEFLARARVAYKPLSMPAFALRTMPGGLLSSKRIREAMHVCCPCLEP